MNEAKSWLCLAGGGVAVRAGDHYDEVVGDNYVWPKSIPHSEEISVGDALALRDGNRLLGFSRIERIEERLESRQRFRCPNTNCSQLQIRERKNMVPRYVCAKCGTGTEAPKIEEFEQECYVAYYAAGWVALDRHIDIAACTALQRNPKTQHSIREMDEVRFVQLVGSLPETLVKPFQRRHKGHVKATVKVRLGQGPFRKKLRDRYGDVCALTGPNHESALEAAHLYSYAAYGEHHDDGGLLLRRDVHRLFDLGYLAVEPHSLTVDVHPELTKFTAYESLHGQALAVDVPAGVRTWLEKHWDEFRS